MRIGITGGIGSGKSIVSRLLQVMGVPVYISDIEGRRLMETNYFVRKQLIDLLGDEVYVERHLNKPMLASYLFANEMHAFRINQIVHPQVRVDFRKWVERYFQTAPLVGIESAILVEAGFSDEVDKIVMVYAPMNIRIERVMERDHIPCEQVEQRIRAQMSDEEKLLHAHYTIINDGKTPLIPQVLKLISLLSSK